MTDTQILAALIYVLPLLIIWLFFSLRRAKQHNEHKEIHQESVEAGLTEPASLHPVIDSTKCIGCGSCVSACPEKNVLGLIHGKAELISPANCIGHGACKKSCPFDAIDLVFGSEKRGVEIPSLTPEFETNVSGIYISGELGGMGLVKNAIEQGKQAMTAIKKNVNKGRAKYDVVIVGAGPAGIAACLSAKSSGLNYLCIEQDSLGGTVAHFPRKKMVMTAPVQLPLVGKVKFRETSKEELLEFWTKVVNKEQLTINYGEKLEDIEQQNDQFIVKTAIQAYETDKVLLCLGRRGTPRKLNVPGEEQSKVVYRLTDPAQYKGQHVLVVGGGDSALEAAVSLSEEPGTTVSLSYRSGSFGRAKPKNRNKVDMAAEAKQLQLFLSSNIKNIGEDSVDIETSDGEIHHMKNNAVIICAGGILPTPFLKKIGIEVDTKYGTA